MSMPNNTNSPSRSPTATTSTNNNNELIAEIAAKGKSTLKKTSPRPSGSVMMFTEKGMVPMTPASPPTATVAAPAATNENNTTPTPSTTPSAMVATNEQTSKSPVVPAAQQPPRLKDRADRLVLEGEFDPKNFLDQVPDKDSGGRDIPPWKRHVLARQLAEKAKNDDDERKKQAEEEKRYKNVPAWKRALMEKKSAEIKAAQAPKKEAKNAPPVAPKAVASRVVVNGEGNMKPPWQNDLKSK